MKKFVAILALCLTCVFCAISFTACDTGKTADTRDAQIVSIYNTYVAYAEENGATPLPYEEWLKSIKGEKGENGKDGNDGKDGKDGVGIKNAEIDVNGDLIITYEDDKTVNAGKVFNNENPQGLDFYLQSNDTYVVDIGHASLLPSVTIPTHYNGKAITGIMQMYSKEKDIKDIFETVQKIYYSGTISEWVKLKKTERIAYSDYEIYIDGEPLSEMTELILQDIDTIPQYAFTGLTGLTQLIIPQSVTNIDKSAFSGCNLLANISVSVNNPNYSSQDGILYNKEKTEIIYVPKAISGNITMSDTLSNINHYAFSGCSNLTSVTFANTNGWKVSYDIDMSNAIDISSSDLANTATAAQYLTNTYRYYYWQRG